MNPDEGIYLQNEKKVGKASKRRGVKEGLRQRGMVAECLFVIDPVVLSGFFGGRGE